MLVVFSLGVGLGALCCERLSGQQLEIGLVPLGALGMSVFAVDVYFSTHALPAVALMDVSEFLSQTQHWRVLLDLFLLSLSVGIFSVPMYALIQSRSLATHRARIIAANNILNALFMIASALIAGAMLSAGLSTPEVFLWLGLANAVVSAAVFACVPDYLIRCKAWLTTWG